MAIAVALVVLALGSVLFHFLSPWYFTPIASNWHTIDTTIAITFWVTGIVFVAVSVFMAWSSLRTHVPAEAAEIPDFKVSTPVELPALLDQLELLLRYRAPAFF